jgi:hypothetical protein
MDHSRKIWPAVAIAIVIWIFAGIADAQRHAPIVVRWQNGDPNSDLIMRNGRELLILQQGGLSVVVNLAVSHPRQVALVYVRNATDRRFEVVPSEMSFDLVEPARKPFAYQDPDELAKSLRRVSPWAYVFAAMAGMATQQSHTTGTVTTAGGSTAFINSTTTAPDNAARDRTIQNLSETQLAKEVAASKIQDIALRENTVLPGEGVWGHVFFNPPKHYERDYAMGKLECILRVPISDYVFEFPYVWEVTMEPRYRSSDILPFPSSWKAKR